jgi:hypothetical protein
MTATGRCPTCGRGPRRTVFAAVVAGQVDPKRAPRLTRAWGAILSAVHAQPGRPAAELRDTFEAGGIAASNTFDHLVRAAVAAGLLHRTYEWGGSPIRRRAHLWPRP